MENRLNEYKNILSANKAFLTTTQICSENTDNYSDKMYFHVWAPAVLEYVIWIINKAREIGIERLYFLSRDAYPMYICAKTIVKRLGPNIECRYLRVSRISLRMPEYHLIGEDCLDSIFISGIDVSLRTIFERGGLTESEIYDVCKEADYKGRIDEILNRRDIYNLKEYFSKNSKTLLDYIYTHSREKIDDTLGYLNQEGMLEDVSWAVVDSGWIGTIQRSIRNILRISKNDIKVRGFYFGLYEKPYENEGLEYYTYHFSPDSGIKKKIAFSNCLFEAVYSEPLSMVVGYKKKQDSFIPIFSENENPNKDYLERNKELIKKYVDCYVEQISKGASIEVINLCGEIFGKLMGHPNAWEAKYYGSLKFCDDINEKCFKNTAYPLNIEQIRDLGAVSKLLIMCGISKKKIHESAWIEGSIVNNGDQIELNLKRAKFAKYLTYLRLILRQKKHV